MATIATTTDKKNQPAEQAKAERKPQRARRDDKFKIFSGSANEPLADEICNFLGMTRGQDRKSTRLNSSHIQKSRMPSSA